MTDSVPSVGQVFHGMLQRWKREVAFEITKLAVQAEQEPIAHIVAHAMWRLDNLCRLEQEG